MSQFASLKGDAAKNAGAKLRAKILKAKGAALRNKIAANRA